MSSPNFIALAYKHQAGTFGGPLGSGTKEFVSTIDHITDKQRDHAFVGQDTFLFDDGGVRVVAIAPSSATSIDALTAAAIRALEQAKPGDSVSEPTPNASSIVLAVRCVSFDVVLGGDLIKEKWPEAIASLGAKNLSGSIVKVPHHGSEGADYPPLWAGPLRPDVDHATTRFNKGAQSIPTHDDRARLRARSPNGYVIGCPSSRLHLYGNVGRRVRAGTRDGIWRCTGPVGHYQWRVPIDEGAGPEVAISGEAVTI